MTEENDKTIVFEGLVIPKMCTKMELVLKQQRDLEGNYHDDPYKRTCVASCFSYIVLHLTSVFAVLQSTTFLFWSRDLHFHFHFLDRIFYKVFRYQTSRLQYCKLYMNAHILQNQRVLATYDMQFYIDNK